MPAVMPRKKPAPAGRPALDRPSANRPSAERSSPARPSAARAPVARPPVAPSPAAGKSAASDAQPKPEPEILFQNYFKSIGPRTYAAQVKRAGNGNHFLVLTEGKRDDKTSDVRKTKLFVFSEDFSAFFRMLHETAKFIRENPVPDDVRQRREKFWTKHKGTQKFPGTDSPARASSRRRS